MSISDRLYQLEREAIEENEHLMLAALRAVLDLHKPTRIYAGTTRYEVDEARESGQAPFAVVCVECCDEEVREAVDSCYWDDSMAGTVDWPCDTYRAVEAALGGDQT